jgi:hypothetical protein
LRAIKPKGLNRIAIISLGEIKEKRYKLAIKINKM